MFNQVNGVMDTYHYLIGTVHHSSNNDKTKQQLTFSQSEHPHSPVAMDTTSGCIILPPTPPTKKVRTADIIDKTYTLPIHHILYI